MRTTALLVILLLTLGLSLGSAPALAEDQAVIQSMPVACQPVSEAELAQLNGKFFSFDSSTLFRVAFCAYRTFTPVETQQRIYRVVQAVRTCFGHGGQQQER
jgi:hypothetical protein